MLYIVKWAQTENNPQDKVKWISYDNPSPFKDIPEYYYLKIHQF